MERGREGEGEGMERGRKRDRGREDTDPMQSALLVVRTPTTLPSEI